MCRKIRCDGESCKVLSFWVYLNKALLHPKIQKLFKISRHIESYGIYMRH